MSLSENIMASISSSISSHWAWISSAVTLATGAIGAFFAAAFWSGKNVERLTNKMDNMTSMIGSLNTQMATQIERGDEHMKITQKNAVDIANIKGRLES